MFMQYKREKKINLSTDPLKAVVLKLIKELKAN